MEFDVPPLSDRQGLPDALRTLLETFPRENWTEHRNYAGLLAFWLDRHQMFRGLLGMLREDAQNIIENNTEFEVYAPRLQRYGSMFLSELHGHHRIEDVHYFPKLVALEAPLARGFEMLDADHHAMDALLQAFADRANSALKGREVGPFWEEVQRFEVLLDRHLLDEEDLIVPVILKHGPDRLETV